MFFWSPGSKLPRGSLRISKHKNDLVGEWIYLLVVTMVLRLFARFLILSSQVNAVAHRQIATVLWLRFSLLPSWTWSGLKPSRMHRIAAMRKAKRWAVALSCGACKSSMRETLR